MWASWCLSVVRLGGSFAIVGGNWNNGSKCGRYVNLNNPSSNANANIGARIFIIAKNIFNFGINWPCPLAKIIRLRRWLVRN